MNVVDPRAFEYVLSEVKDGNIFERFIQDLLCQILGQEFKPTGGVKDRGIDGLEHCISPIDIELTVFSTLLLEGVLGIDIDLPDFLILLLTCLVLLTKSSYFCFHSKTSVSSCLVFSGIELKAQIFYRFAIETELDTCKYYF